MFTKTPARYVYGVIPYVIIYIDSEQLIRDLNKQAEEMERRAKETEDTLARLELRGREMEGRWREAEHRANEAVQRLAQMEGRLNEEEGRSREMEGQLREMEVRWRVAEQTASSLRQQNQDTSWVLERSEIHLTEYVALHSRISGFLRGNGFQKSSLLSFFLPPVQFSY